MISDQDIKQIFKAHQFDVSDEGFSTRVANRLPERASILPQVVMILCVVLGFSLTIAIQGITPILTQLTDLITAVGNLQLPSISSIMTYLIGLVMLGMIGFSVAWAKTE